MRVFVILCLHMDLELAAWVDELMDQDTSFASCHWAFNNNNNYYYNTIISLSLETSFVYIETTHKRYR